MGRTSHLTIGALAALAAFPTGGWATVAKHTVHGTGTVELERARMRAPINHVTLHPIGNAFSLTLAGRTCWVFVGGWNGGGDAISLKVANLNNAPANGSGEVRLDDRGKVTSLKLNGSSRSGAFRANFKTGAKGELTREPAPPSRPAPAKPVAEGPSEDEPPRPAPAPARPAPPEPVGNFDVQDSEWGTGLLRREGEVEARIGVATATINRSGRASIRLGVMGIDYHFEGSWQRSADNAAALSLRPLGGFENDVATGTAWVSPSGRELRAVELKGRIGGRSFTARFDAQYTRQ